MNNKIRFTVHATQQFTEDDIIEIVGIDNFNAIKEKKPGGIFKAFVLCHEGVSNAAILGKGQYKIWWGKKAIQSAYEKLKTGIRFFYRHNSDNSISGREEFGEVVGKAHREIAGRDSVVVVGHFPEDKKRVAEKSNSVSMEAIWDMVRDGARIVAEGVSEIAQIALGDPAKDQPAFDGARELITVQAFEPENDTKSRKIMDWKELDPVNMDFQKVRDLIRYFKIHPSQIYSMEDIFGQLRKQKNGSATWTGGDTEVRKFVEDEFLADVNTEVEKYKTEITKHETEKAGLKKDLARHNALPRLQEMAKERAIPDRVLNLAKANLDKFDPGENLDESLKTFLDAQAKEDERLIKLGYAPSNGQEQREYIKPALGPGKEQGSETENPFLPRELVKK